MSNTKGLKVFGFTQQSERLTKLDLYFQEALFPALRGLHEVRPSYRIQVAVFLIKGRRVISSRDAALASAKVVLYSQETSFPALRGLHEVRPSMAEKKRAAKPLF